MTAPDRLRQKARSNGRIALIFGGLALGMVGVAFAAVPAYRLFCQVTGYGGTPQRVSGAEDVAQSQRTIVVRFDASLNQDVPWEFRPEQKQVTVHLGERKLVAYEARNLSDENITGTATFNVTPLKAAQYFSKVDCFCFTEQTLQPGQRADMPVTFYVDPAIADDADVADVHTITLSYTFFRKKGGDT